MIIHFTHETTAQITEVAKEQNIKAFAILLFIILIVAIVIIIVILMARYPSKAKMASLYKIVSSDDPKKATYGKEEYSCYYYEATAFHRLRNCNQGLYYFFQVTGFLATLVTVYFTMIQASYILVAAVISSACAIISLSIDFKSMAAGFAYAAAELDTILLQLLNNEVVTYNDTVYKNQKEITTLLAKTLMEVQHKSDKTQF